MSSPFIIAIAGDAGGANALAPVLLALKSKYQIKVFAYLHAVHLWEARGIPLTHLGGKFNTEDAENILLQNNPSLLLTGTSHNRFNYEKLFVDAANKLNLSSVSLVDFWSNYRVRFSDNQNHLRFLPTHIAIMNEQAKMEMLNEGFDSSILHVTGQPALEEVIIWKKSFSSADRKQVRENLGINPATETFVMFASQPLSLMLHSNKLTDDYRGYTEKTVLPQLIQTLSMLSGSDNKIFLGIKPHPREDLSWLRIKGNNNLRISIINGMPSRELIMAADIVSGMNSMLLMEACLLGLPTVSMQPGLRIPDALPSNRQGISIPVYSVEDIYTVFSDLLNKPNALKGNDRLSQLVSDHTFASKRVIKLIDKIIEDEKCLN